MQQAEVIRTKYPNLSNKIRVIVNTVDTNLF